MDETSKVTHTTPAKDEFFSAGMHMFHVFTGCVYLLVVAGRVNKLKHEDVEISGLYWHFVDLVWMFVFPMIYLLSIYPKK